MNNYILTYFINLLILIVFLSGIWGLVKFLKGKGVKYYHLLSDEEINKNRSFLMRILIKYNTRLWSGFTDKPTTRERIELLIMSLIKIIIGLIFVYNYFIIS